MKTGRAYLPKFVCVLKSGGAYYASYVYALRNALREHVSYWSDSRFICLTDIDLPSINTLPLKDGLPGWWSKIEIFKIMGPVVYIDLDTIIVDSLDPLVEGVKNLHLNQFMMLQAFNRREKWASGIMGWKGNWSWLHEVFNPKTMNGYRRDQRYIKRALLARGVNIRAVQDDLSGVYSYKHHCTGELPPDARVICFHGKPRPDDVRHEHEWCQRVWAA